MKTNLSLLKNYPELYEIFRQMLEEIKLVSRPANEILLDDVQLCEMLHVSKRTVATWRQKGLIKHSWLQGKCFYKYSDILAAIDQNAINPIKNQLKIKL